VILFQNTDTIISNGAVRLNRHYPPVTSIDAPFTYELLSEARKAMTSATSEIEIKIKSINTNIISLNEFTCLRSTY
jgi:hypothetical protein